MPIARRVYVYLVCAASLSMLVAGTSVLGSATLQLTAGGGALDLLRGTIAGSAAAALVALPVWVLHWGWAQRTAARHLADRTSALRRLYLYTVAGALALMLGLLGSQLLENLLALPEGARAGVDGTQLGSTAWQVALVTTFWVYHMRTAGRDRAAEGEWGASATLRRWYAYGIQLLAVVIVLFGARELLAGLPANLAQDSGIVGTSTVPRTAARTVAWLGIWLVHLRWAATGAVAQDDRHSALRAVQGFGVVALSFILVVFDGSRLLYFGLARALGVEAPGGVGQLDVATLAQPIATAVVFGSTWMLTRRRLLLDMVDAQAPRQAGVRRLYVHLVALLALVALAGGVGGLLQTLIELALPSLPTREEIWREQVSLFVTLVAVGLPLWLLHWRPSPALNERGALSRRLYLFAVLLGSMLALLGASAALLTTLLNGLLSADTTPPSLAVSRSLSAMLTAGAIAAYHWRVLRQDALRAAEVPAPEVPSGTLPSLVVEVSGATETEIRQALGHLPQGARYSLEMRETANSRE